MAESLKRVDAKKGVSPEQQILNAAMATMAERKISGTRMRHIADRAAISQGTLHYYFPTKSDLFVAMLDAMQASFDADRRERLAKGGLRPAEKIKLFPIQQRRILIETPALLELWFDFWAYGVVDPEIRPKIQWMYDEWRHDMADVVSEGVETGDFELHYAHLAPQLLISLLEGGAMQYLLEGEVLDLNEYFDAVCEVMLNVLERRPDRTPYPTDIKDGQWEQVQPLLPSAKEGGRPASVDLREVVNAIVYVRHCDCSWRMLPHDFPSWQTVYGYYSRWAKDGTLERINPHLSVDLMLSTAATTEMTHV